MRRPEFLPGVRYCGNTYKRTVHDLDNESERCGIDAMIASGHAAGFDSLDDAHAERYDDCDMCIGPSAKTVEKARRAAYEHTFPPE